MTLSSIIDMDVSNKLIMAIEKPVKNLETYQIGIISTSERDQMRIPGLLYISSVPTFFKLKI